MTEFWHNPRCSKSRQTLDLVRQKDPDISVRLYQVDAPDEAELRTVLEELGIEPRDLIRAKDKLARELGITADMDADELIRAMVAHPALIERPILRAGGRAVIGRPPESVLLLLD